MGHVYSYGLTDFQAIATGAAVLASGGGGSYHGGATNACGVVCRAAAQHRLCGWYAPSLSLEARADAIQNTERNAVKQSGHGYG